MPTTPYASVLLALNGGSAVAGTIEATAEDVIQCSTLSTVGWKTSNLPTVWQITTYPAGWVADAGWVLNAVTKAYEYTVGGATGMLPPPITMPTALEVAGGLWGKWKIRLLVNGGGGQLTDWTAGISVLSQTGLEEVAVLEGTEFDPVRRWVGALQRAQRIWDAAIAGGVGGGVSLGAGTPAVLTASAGANGALATAAPYDHRHQVQTAICVTIGAANSAGSSASLAHADHVHDHGALLGGDRHALAVAGVSHGFISATNQTKLEGIAAGAQVVNWTNVRAAVATASSDLPLNGQRITGLANGVGAQDAATIAQLSALANGLDLKTEVRGASLANQPLSGALTEDGITYADGDRYGAKDQTDQTQNGIWVVDTAGAWARSTDADTDAEVTPGMFFFVKEGTVNGKTGWALMVAGPITVGVTNLVFTQIFGPGTIVAGAGIAQSGNTFNVGAGHGVQVNANDIDVIYGAVGDLTTVNGGDTASAGALDKAARADHQHAVSTAASSALVVTDGGAAAEGSATSLLRSDAVLVAETAAPVAVGEANAIGISTKFARHNHVHDHGNLTGGARHALAVAGVSHGFMSSTDKTKLDGVAASAAAAGSATPLPPSTTSSVGVAAATSHEDHVHPWGTAATGLALYRPQNATGDGLTDVVRGQAAMTGAYTGGKQVLGGGDAGDSSHKNGDTAIVIGLAPTGGSSAALDICSADGGTSYLSVTYSDSASKVTFSSAVKAQMSMSLRHNSTLSHAPFAETNGATVTMAEGKSIRRRVTIAQNTTFANPTGFEDGTELILFVKQGGTGSYTASWGVNFTFPSPLSGTLVGTAVNDVDVFRFLLEIDKWVCVTHYNYAG